MSTSLRPEQNCTNVQIACIAAPDGGSPEISDEIFEHIVNYQRMLAVPARRNLDVRGSEAGARLFVDVGLRSLPSPDTCDRRERRIRRGSASRRFIPFTDLLLHDMGTALADGRADFEASGSEWRTPPLWGLGLQQTVNRPHAPAA